MMQYQVKINNVYYREKLPDYGYELTKNDTFTLNGSAELMELAICINEISSSAFPFDELVEEYVNGIILITLA